MGLRQHGWVRLPVLATLALGMLGCVVIPAVEDSYTPKEGVIRDTRVSYRESNGGRILGTLVADSNMQSWGGVSGLGSATAQAFDSDGTAISDAVNVDDSGHFVLQSVKDSRPRIFVAVNLGTLQFRATTEAPRTVTDYDVRVDASSTFLADKLRRAAIDQQVPFDRLDADKVKDTEDVVGVYMQSDETKTVLSRKSDFQKDLNAHEFDRFMEEYLPVKMAVFALSPSILRGWKPPKPSPIPVPTDDPNASPTPTPSDTPSACPTCPAPH